MTTTRAHKTCTFPGTVILSFLVTFGLSYSMPPCPTGGKAAAPATKVTSSFYETHLSELHARGICAPDDFFFGHNLAQNRDERSPAVTGPFRVLALLVTFTDHPSTVGATFFDSLVFGANGATVRDYYSQISYGQLDLITVNLPSQVNWSTAPQPYTYYVNGAQGMGTYPNNSQKLVEDLVDLVDSAVDFSPYDNDGDGDVDVLLVIHSGSGAELTSSNNDIWSHKWAISPRLKDGKYLSSYTVQPEYWRNPGDMTIGVYAHELAHGFGLPDLYDTDGTSYGVGRWCLMSYGSWNGPGGLGGSPSHPSAWCRSKMGFASPVNVTINSNNQSIANIEQNPTIFRLWTSGTVGNEYYLIENRQKTGYDSYLNGAGLLIWHVDEAKSDNTQEWFPGQPNNDHLKVALVQADGLFQLEHKSGIGDANDPFPGSLNKVDFNAISSPNSNSYQNGNSFVGVTGISSSAATMQANLVVGFSSGTDTSHDVTLPASATISQNYPNPFNPSTRMEFTLLTDASVSLDVFNALGQKVRSLYNGRALAGSTKLTWDGKDDRGIQLPTGVYLYRMAALEQVITKKMLLLH